MNANATETVATDETVFVTVRLRLAVGAYSKTGGKARIHVNADGSFEYENSRGERSPINGIQAERYYSARYGFNVLNGFNDPLVRKSRSDSAVNRTDENIDPNEARKNPLSDEKVAELRELVGATVKKK